MFGNVLKKIIFETENIIIYLNVKYVVYDVYVTSFKFNKEFWKMVSDVDLRVAYLYANFYATR